MEAIAFIGGIVVIVGGYWSVTDLMQECGLDPTGCIKTRVAEKTVALKTRLQASSDFRSRDISSSTACRAGLLQ